MTPRELGARWLAAGGGWAPGMRVLAAESDPGDPPTEATYVVAVDKDGATVAWSEYPGTAEGGLTLSDDVPDVADPATLGAMLGALRERWGGDLWIQGMVCYPPGDGPILTRTGPALRWVVGGLLRRDGERVNGDGPDGFDSEAEAMVAAMESRKRG